MLKFTLLSIMIYGITAKTKYYYYDDEDNSDNAWLELYGELSTDFDTFWYSDIVWDEIDSITTADGTIFKMKCADNMDICVCQNQNDGIMTECKEQVKEERFGAYEGDNDYYYEMEEEEEMSGKTIAKFVRAQPVATVAGHTVSSIVHKLSSFHWTTPNANTRDGDKVHVTIQQDAMCLLIYEAGRDPKVSESVKEHLTTYIGLAGARESRNFFTTDPGMCTARPSNLNFYYDTRANGRKTFAQVYGGLTHQIYAKSGGHKIVSAVEAGDQAMIGQVRALGTGTQVYIGQPGTDTGAVQTTIGNILNSANRYYYKRWYLEQNADQIDCHFT